MTSQLSQPSSSISARVVGKNGAMPNRLAQYGRYETSGFGTAEAFSTRPAAHAGYSPPSSGSAPERPGFGGLPPPGGGTLEPPVWTRLGIWVFSSALRARCWSSVRRSKHVIASSRWVALDRQLWLSALQ